MLPLTLAEGEPSCDLWFSRAWPRFSNKSALAYEAVLPVSTATYKLVTKRRPLMSLSQTHVTPIFWYFSLAPIFLGLFSKCIT